MNEIPLATIAVGTHVPMPQSLPVVHSWIRAPLQSGGSVHWAAAPAAGTITDASPHAGVGSNAPEMQQTLASLSQLGLAMHVYLFSLPGQPAVRSTQPAPGQQAFVALLQVSLPPLASGQSKN